MHIVGLSFLNMKAPEDCQAALTRWETLGRSYDQARESLVSCTVELFGVARLRAKTAEVSLELPRDATLAHVLLALSEKLPTLVGPVIAPDKSSLSTGHACNINGRDFVRSMSTKVNPGDKILIISADAGG